jgi:flagellar motor switch protein FliN
MAWSKWNMSSSNPTATEKWILDQWADETARTLQSMTDARPVAACGSVPSGADSQAFEAGTLYLEVTFSLAPATCMWVAVPPDAAKAMGGRTLKAAGIDDFGPEEVQNTCLEIVQQAHAGLAQAISSRVKRAVSSKGREVDSISITLPLFRLEITYPDAPPIITFLGLAPALLSSLDPPIEPETVAVAASDGRPSQMAASKTFEVLLDVSMPVSVSFGRTTMPIKDVLKLTTGSIVELNRALTEPVEVIINDRVIARGEVVVVDGNYGVRILHIVSRQERFQSTAHAALISKSETHS